MWGEINIRLREVIAFNNFDNIWNLFRSEDADTTDIVVMDASDSMNKYQSTMKLMAGCLKCVSKTQGKWDLPAAHGLTALVDAVNVAHKRLVDAGLAGEGNGRIIVISDGMDNDSRTKELLSDHDTRIPMPSSSQRVQAVADHINFLGCEMIVVGIGTEVKELVAACNKPGRVIKTALVEKNATAAEVGAVMREVVRRSRNPALRGSHGRLPASAAPNSDGSIGTVTAQNAPRVSDEDAAPIASEGAKTADSNAAKAKKLAAPKPVATITKAEERRLLKDRQEAALARYEPTIRTVYLGEKFDNAAQVAYVKLLIERVCKRDVHLQAWVEGALTWFDGYINARVPEKFASPGLLWTRQYPSSNDEFAGPVFASPLPRVLKGGKDATDPVWQRTLKELFLALTSEPTTTYMSTMYPGIQAEIVQLPEGEIGPLYIDLGKMGWHEELTETDLPQLIGRSKNLYYKFKPKDHMHVVRNPRADAMTFVSGRRIEEFTVATNGNSGGSRVAHNGKRAFEERPDTPIPSRSSWFATPSGVEIAAREQCKLATEIESQFARGAEEDEREVEEVSKACDKDGDDDGVEDEEEFEEVEDEVEEVEEVEDEVEEVEEVEDEVEEVEEANEVDASSNTSLAAAEFPSSSLYELEEGELDDFENWQRADPRFADETGNFSGKKWYKAKYYALKGKFIKEQQIDAQNRKTINKNAKEIATVKEAHAKLRIDADKLKNKYDALAKSAEGLVNNDAVANYKETIAELVVSERNEKRKREEVSKVVAGMQKSLGNALKEIDELKAKHKNFKSVLAEALG
jgi:hypothetical protein